jgi:hypothetical protein
MVANYRAGDGNRHQAPIRRLSAFRYRYRSGSRSLVAPDSSQLART